MWDQYRKTFVGMQTVIVVVTAMVFVWSHFWVHAVAFFVMMQTGSVFGALWGHRLKRKLQPQPCRTIVPRI
jgi:uncharacterized membrane protein YfcA